MEIQHWCIACADDELGQSSCYSQYLSHDPPWWGYQKIGQGRSNFVDYRHIRNGTHYVDYDCDGLLAFLTRASAGGD